MRRPPRRERRRQRARTVPKRRPHIGQRWNAMAASAAKAAAEEEMAHATRAARQPRAIQRARRRRCPSKAHRAAVLPRGDVEAATESASEGDAATAAAAAAADPAAR